MRPGVRVAFDVGSVRMTERHLHSDPPTAAEVAAARADVRAALDRAARVVPIGQAATITRPTAISGRSPMTMASDNPTKGRRRSAAATPQIKAFGRNAKIPTPHPVSYVLGRPLLPADYDDPASGKQRYQLASERIMAAIAALELPARPLI